MSGTGDMNPWDMIASLAGDDKRLFERVKKIIDDWDPHNLWCCHCPPDEYNCENWDIFQILKAGGGEEELNNYFTYLHEEMNYLDAGKLKTLMSFSTEISRRLAALTTLSDEGELL